MGPPRVCSCLLVAAIMAPAASATQPAAAPFRMTDLGENAPLRIDGILEAAWGDVPAIDEFIEYRPRQGVPASVRTEVRLARDARHVYIAARMFDPNIARLRTGLARRDNFSNEQDWISIAVDPVGTRRVAQLFYFNPDGVVWDGLSNEDAGTASSAADFEVEVATRINADSWVVEMRIPFNELRYASRTPENWHLLIRRNYPRQERHAMAAPAIPANAPCFMCLAAPIRPPGELPSPSSLSVVPHAVALGSAADLGSGEEWHTDLEPGLDAKWRLGPTTVFDAALNPDFSQVELDTPQLSSNRQFAVSLPEKRPFFLEGIDMLDSPLTAIYTRSITDPAWGLRGTNRGSWDGVLLTAVDDGGGFMVLPGAYSARYLLQDFRSHATVGRLRKPVGALTFGALLTDRRAGDGYNTVAGPDVTWRLSPGARINAQWLASRTNGDGEFPGVGGSDTADGDAFTLDMLHESPHWHGTLLLQRLDEEFRADNGYVPQVGIRSVTGEVRYKLSDLPRIAELAPYLTGDWREDLDGVLVSLEPRVGALTTFTNNLVLTTEWRPREQLRLQRDGELHEYAQGYLAMTAYPGGQLPTVTLSAVFGDAVDFASDRVGHGETYGFSALWRPLSRLEVQPSVDYTTVRSGAELSAGRTRESIAQLLATLHLSARDRFRLILQRVDAERESTGPRADYTREVGSLLFTHERSLTRRVDAGISYTKTTDQDSAPVEGAEVFVKFQWGLSSTGGFHW
jgi:Domain of unknown function (DUF5916)